MGRSASHVTRRPAQPDRNADRPLEERHRAQAPRPPLLQADHGGPPGQKDLNTMTALGRPLFERIA